MGEARLFQALSDGTRLEILSVLAAGTVNVSRIVAHLGCSQPAVSRHLRVLREASLIRGARKGKQVEYSINPDALRAAVRRLERMVIQYSEGVNGTAGAAGTPGVVGTAGGVAVAPAVGTARRGAKGKVTRSGKDVAPERSIAAARGEIGRARTRPGRAPSRDWTPTESKFKVERKSAGMDDFLL